MIFESVTCTRRETTGRLAYTISIEAPAPLRLARGLARDCSFAGAEQLWQKWMADEEQFVSFDGTRDRADLIIDTADHGDCYTAATRQTRNSVAESGAGPGHGPALVRNSSEDQSAVDQRRLD